MILLAAKTSHPATMFIGYSVLRGIQKIPNKKGVRPGVFDVPLKIISVSYALCPRFVRSPCVLGVVGPCL